jgi:hypothetical protein
MPDQPKHTPTPWECFETTDATKAAPVGVLDGKRNIRVCDVGQRGMSVDEINANSRRLAACWNACEGIPTADLEKAAAHDDGRVRLSKLSDLADAAMRLAFDAATQPREHLRDDVAQPHEPAASA